MTADLLTKNNNQPSKLRTNKWDEVSNDARGT